MAIRKANFAIADDGSKTYEGYTFGRTWNGWECPYFTKEIALEMMKEFDNEDQPAHYDEDTDTFVYVMDADDPDNMTDYYKGEDHDYNGETIHLYGIGVMGWIWDEIEDVEEEEE